MTLRPGVFLDRDGVLNASPVSEGVPVPPRSIDELELLPGVEEACRVLADAGYPLVVVTNQPDVARGTTSLAVVSEINDSLSDRLALAAVLVCPHDDTDGCDCRKPLPGMLVRGAAELSLDLARSVMVGDRWKDVVAGQAAGAATIFVDHGYPESRPVEADWTVHSLIEAVPIILNHLETRSLNTCRS